MRQQLTNLLFLVNIINSNTNFENRTNPREGLKTRGLTRNKNEATQHWEKVNWEEYKHCKVRQVCRDEVEKCENGVKWKNLAEEFKKSGQVEIVDISSSKRLVPEHVEQKDIEQYRQASCDLAFVTYGEESYGRNYENYGGDSGSYYGHDFEGNNETVFEENYGSGFEGNYGEDFEGNYGDFGGGEDCQVWHTENQCPWMTQAEYTMWANGLNYSSMEKEYKCEPQIVGSDPEIGNFPNDCKFGPGWTGTLKTTIEEGRYMIYWAALVQQPSCVEAVTLIDKKTDMSKEFWTSESEVNFPVEYPKTTCDMKILLYAHRKCFSVNTKVRCEKETGAL